MQGARDGEIAEAARQLDFATCTDSEEMLFFSCAFYSNGPRNTHLFYKDSWYGSKREDKELLKGCGPDQLGNQH